MRALLEFSRPKDGTFLIDFHESWVSPWEGSLTCCEEGLGKGSSSSPSQKKQNSLPFRSVVLPPDKAPSGKLPVGVSPFNCNTLSLSSLKDRKLCNKNQTCVLHIVPHVLSSYLPEHREHSCHLSNCTNLVPNNFFSCSSCSPYKRCENPLRFRKMT